MENGAFRPRFSFGHVAGHTYPVQLPHVRTFCPTDVLRNGTTRVKRAAGWRIDRIGNFPLGWLNLAAEAIQRRCRCQQHLRVEMVFGDCCIVFAGSGSPSKEPGLRGVFEQPADEFDFAFDAWILVMDVSAFDGADCLDTTEGRLGRSQGSEALSVSE